MKRQCFLLVLAIMGLCVCSCSKDNDEEDNPSSVVVKDDGTTSNGSIFSAIDDKNFYLDYVKYTVEEGHLVVSGYDIVGFKGGAKIASRITYKGNTYEVLSIGYGAFYNCTGLESIEISENVTSIGERAFQGCSKLTSVEIPKSVKKIGEWAFSGCSKLTSIVIPNSVTSFGRETFSGCTGLTSIDIPNSVTSIGGGVFSGCTGLTSVTIPNSVTSIGGSVFSGCTGLTSVVMGNGVTNIGDYAFFNCTGLTSFIIPNSVTDIGSNAFRGCKGLTSVVIGYSVINIGNYAFSGCSNLTSIEIPNSIMNIGEWAFENTGLKSVFSQVTNPQNVSLWNSAFGTKRDSLFVPTGTINQYLSSNWKNFFKFIIDGDNIVNTEQGGNNQNEVIQDNYYKYQDSFNFQGVGTMTMIGEATFQSGKCTAIAITYIYPTKSFASQVWKSYQEDENMKSELPNYSYDGDKTIVYRFDSETVASYSATLGKQGVCDLIKYTVQTTMSSLSDSISK